MKKTICILAAAVAAVGLAAVLIKKKNKTNIKIICQCGEKQDKTEQAITTEEIKEGENKEITVPVDSSKKPINLSLNNASLGNVSYSIVIK